MPANFMAGIHTTLYDFVDSAAIIGKVDEVRGSAQQQRDLHPSLDMAVGARVRTVLVGNTCVVARRLMLIRPCEKSKARATAIGRTGRV